MTASPEPRTIEPKRVPDFFIVGHPKSGTTALYEALKRHPQIYMPYEKEPWFLASEVNSAPPRPIGRTPKTLEEYLALFQRARPDQLAGEASPLYLWSHAAAGRIAALQPNARIIAILREPASFLRSLHLQFLQMYVETEKDFRKAIALEDSRSKGRNLPRNPYWPGAVLYSHHVRYVEQLRRYQEVFGPEQILVLIYDDLRSDNEGTLRTLLRFLGVDEGVPIEMKEINPAVRVRSQRLFELAHTVAEAGSPVSRAVNATVRTLAPRQLSRESALAIRNRLFFARPHPPDEALLLELRRRFKPEVAALSEHLSRDLVTLWGYDAVD
jgi:hypothetical protein